MVTKTTGMTLTLKELSQCRLCGRKKKYMQILTRRPDGTTRLSCRSCNTARHRKYAATKEGREAIRRAVIKSTKKYLYKQIARIELNKAVRRKEISKPKKCRVCKNTKKLEAHHEDYSKPLEVVWVCRQCHVNL